MAAKIEFVWREYDEGGEIAQARVATLAVDFPPAVGDEVWLHVKQYGGDCCAGDVHQFRVIERIFLLDTPSPGMRGAEDPDPPSIEIYLALDDRGLLADYPDCRARVPPARPS